jgi:argininosuccinate lyase
MLLATDLADYLVRKKQPFRAAHHAVGAVVALAERLKKPLNELTLPELRSVEPGFGPDAKRLFDLKTALSRRNMTGAPGPREVARQLARWQKQLGK